MGILKRARALERRMGGGRVSWAEYEAASGRLAWRGRDEVKGMLARVRGKEPPPSSRPEGYTAEHEFRDDEVVMRWEEEHSAGYDAEQERRAVLDLLARSRARRELR